MTFDPSVTPEQEPPQGVGYSNEPLTHEQEVHSLLWAGKAAILDLKLIFEREHAAGILSPDERRINGVCIENFGIQLARFEAAIPLAEARRSPSSSPTTTTDAALLDAIHEFGHAGVATKLKLTGREVLRWIANGSLNPELPAPTTDAIREAVKYGYLRCIGMGATITGTVATSRDLLQEADDAADRYVSRSAPPSEPSDLPLRAALAEIRATLPADVFEDSVVKESLTTETTRCPDPCPKCGASDDDEQHLLGAFCMKEICPMRRTPDTQPDQ